MTPRPLLRNLFACGVLGCMPACVLSCSAAQDLGRDEPSTNLPAEARDADAAMEHGAGFGAAWACPDSPLARDLACPLTAPIDGDACSSRATAPCMYPADDHDGNDLCLCTKQLRWVCLRQVSFRSLDVPPLSNAACLADGDAPEVTRRCIGDECTACGGRCEVTCRCVAPTSGVGDAVYRCGNGT